MSHIDEIRQSIVDHISELESELAQTRQALAALDGSLNMHRPAATPEKAQPRARKRNGRATKVVPAGTLTAVLAKADGLGTEALAKETGGDRKQILVLLKELEADGKIKRTGERRATRWHVIAENAVEVPKRTSKPRSTAKKSTTKAKAPAKRRAPRKTAEPAPAPVEPQTETQEPRQPELVAA